MRENRWIIAIIGLLVLLIAGGLILKIRLVPHTPPPQTEQVLITEPTIKITDPVRGNKNAPLTIVYYSDFGCDSCATASPMIDALLEDPQLKNKIKFVWKDFPAHKNIFPESYELHKAARCAAAAGHFWEFERVAYLHMQEIHLKMPVLDKVIQESGFDSTAIKTCMQSPGIASTIQDNEDEATQLNITATPTFFIGDKRVEGLLPYYEFAGTIRNQLATLNYAAQKKQ